jgi:very-short-patch-repair endonuclease
MADIKNIFNFLKEFNLIRNPVITEIGDQMWSYKLKDLPSIEELWSVYNTNDYENLNILKIKRPTILPCPAPDESIIDWIDSDWDKLSIRNIEYIESKILSVENENGEFIEEVEYFEDDVDRVEKYNTWKKKRDDWIDTESPKEKGLQLYNELFSIYSRIKKEAENVELVLGDGLIRWRTENRTINHPVLFQKVNLKFKPEIPEFIITSEEIKLELYTPMLRVIESINQTMLSDIIIEVEENSFHIADKNNNIEVFKRVINVIDERGTYKEDYENITNTPVILHEPILFLRKRNLGYTEFIQNIIEDVEDEENKILPNFFENLIGNYRENINSEIIEENWNQSGIDEEILLTKQANNEQMKIIKYLDKYGAVLVQGPPGTGKTHTIANLIGHLLSRGESVLVTSHTEKALSVLKDKVHKDLQSLCVNLLSSSSERKEMDATLFEIAEKSTSFDKNASIARISRLEKQRKELINLYKSKITELIQVRSLQYQDLVYGNTTIKPVEAAKFVREGTDVLDYIPGSTIDDTILLPVEIDELEYIYESNSLINRDEEEFLKKQLPELDCLWDPKELKSITENIFKYKESLVGWKSDFIFNESIAKDDLIHLLSSLRNLIGSINNMSKFEKSIINKSIEDSIYEKFWKEIFDEFEELLLDYKKYRKIEFNNDYKIPNTLFSIEAINILNEIIDSEKEIPINNIIAIIKPKWRKIRESITNGRSVLSKITEYEEVRFIILYTLKKENIIRKINKLLYDIEGQEKIENNEKEARIQQILEVVRSSLSWHKECWLSLFNQVSNVISNIDEYMNKNHIGKSSHIKAILYLANKLEENINNYYYSMLLEGLVKKRNDYLDLLKRYRNTGEIFGSLIESIENNKIDNYGKYYNELLQVYSKKEIQIKRQDILDKLEIYAPEWSNAIRNRIGIHESTNLPENIETAWKWRQLKNQLDRINGYDPNTIQDQIERISNQLMENAKKLAYERAWYKKISNTTIEQTQAIEGWRQTIRQIGRGYGRRVPMLREKARQLMPLCQTAIPVWVMTLNSVTENLDPKKNKFDVIIIDEASQADILALSVLYLGKKIIIVGDDEQVSPQPVGIKANELDALIEQHLQGIPNNHLYNERTSIYDMAKTSGFKPIMLVEHFRCLPEIIEFSNQLSYNGKIKPLRDSSDVNIYPSVVEYRVPSGFRDRRKVNQVEAEHVASLICACIEHEVYKGKTIGVISLVGNRQSYEIDKILQSRLDPKEYENRRIQCGTSAEFQGDERDVIFISMVDSPKESGGTLRLLSASGNNDINRKRYNVAASRARDQMWVVHSLNPEIDLQPDDLRLKLINFAKKPVINRDDDLLNRTESDFEYKVMASLLNKGYRVYPQWNVGAYRIDMVVEDGDNRIAIECDGERWHTQENLSDDLKRQAILERLGWKFIRIRGSEFYLEPEKTMDWVYSELEKNNIKPSVSNEKSEQYSKDNGIVDRIKARAEALRRQWNEENSHNSFNETPSTDSNDTVISLSKEYNTVNSSFSDELIQQKATEKIEFDDRLKPRKNNKTISKPLFDFRNRQ